MIVTYTVPVFLTKVWGSTANLGQMLEDHVPVSSTVKLVYKDHPRDQQNAVLIHRWSLYAGSATWKVHPRGAAKCGLYKQVVFKAGLPVFYM